MDKIYYDVDIIGYNACKICETTICHHGSKLIEKGVYKCLDCGLKVDSYGEMAVCCLPFHEGKVDWESEVYNEVCGKCYMEAVKCTLY